MEVWSYCGTSGIKTGTELLWRLIVIGRERLWTTRLVESDCGTSGIRLAESDCGGVELLWNKRDKDW